MDIITDLDGRLRDTDGGIKEQDIGLMFTRKILFPSLYA